MGHPQRRNSLSERMRARYDYIQLFAPMAKLSFYLIEGNPAAAFTYSDLIEFRENLGILLHLIHQSCHINRRITRK